MMCTGRIVAAVSFLLGVSFSGLGICAGGIVVEDAVVVHDTSPDAVLSELSECTKLEGELSRLKE
jgi:hypothetical protein